MIISTIFFGYAHVDPNKTLIYNLIISIYSGIFGYYTYKYYMENSLSKAYLVCIGVHSLYIFMNIKNEY